MAVVPIRGRMSTPAAAPMSSPQQQGWVWNGSSWVWDPDCCGPSFGCPPFVCNFPPPTVPPTPLTGPILGVTDGSSANPGEVGEFVSGTSNFSYTAYPNVTTVVLSALVVQPGDWQLAAFVSISTDTDTLACGLSPVPPGMSNNMSALVAVGGSAPIVEAVQLNTPVARGNFTVPTLLAFQVTVGQNSTPGLPAGTGYVVAQGRRMR